MNSKVRLITAILTLLIGGASQILAQSITTFSPKFSLVGQQVVIEGSGFFLGGSVTNVTFFNNKTASFFVSSDVQITAFVPAGAATGPITLKKNGGQVSSVEDFIVVGTEPFISDFSPIAGAGGTVVTLNGLNFNGVNSVKFNGTNGGIVQLTSPTTMKVSAPANVTTGPITLAKPGAPSFTTSSNFSGAASITNFAPSKAIPGTTIIIKGRNFVGTSVVKFNNVVAPDFTVDSNSQITVTLPQNATTGLIHINPPGGQANSTSNFVVLPHITSFSPTFGAPGTNVTIIGVNLLGNTKVKFNGSSDASLSTLTSNQIVAVVPGDATSGHITVTTTNGVATSATLFYLPPVISGYTPSTGPVGALVTLTGKNFTNATDVKFNGVSATFGVVNNTTITSSIPANAMSGPISVTTPGGTTSTDQNFFIKPGVISFTPGSGVVGTLVTITGTSFTNVLAVRFNGVDATFFALNNTQLSATVPTNATTGPISVVAPGGTGVSAASFIVDALALAIKLTNNLASISWPTSAAGFNLETSTNLSFTNWTLVTNPPTVVNGRNIITNATTNSVMLYRLKK